MEFLKIFFNMCLLMLAVKTIMGFHWSWEKCQCCEKKWGEHNGH